jgi:hypothetical protein
MNMNLIKLPKILFIGLITAYCILHTAYNAKAADYLRCQIGQSCVVGEFFYDDSYLPIATASCTLTSHRPDNSILGSFPLTGTSDGWYATDVNTTGLPEGLYPSQLCCSYLGDLTCIDKSFKAQVVAENGQLTGTDIANAVWTASPGAYTSPETFGNFLQNLTPENIWNYSTRSLSGFGTLISDLWGYTNRSLTDNSTLITNIWNHPARTLTNTDTLTQNIWEYDDRSLTQEVNTDTSGLASKSDITDIKTTLANLQLTGGGSLDYSDKALLQKIAVQVNQNRDLLDAIINQPIIQSFIEEGAEPDLQSKLNQTKQIADRFFATSEQLQSRAGLIDLKASKLSSSEIDTELSQLLTLLDDFPNDLKWLSEAWRLKSVQDISSDLQNIRTTLANARSSPSVNLTSALQSLANLETHLGNVTSMATEPSLFGEFKAIVEKVKVMDDNDLQFKVLTTTWGDLPSKDQQAQVDALKIKVLAINHLSNATDLINEKPPKAENQTKNQLLALQAVNSINRSLLASFKDKPVRGVWLAEGSVIFRTLVTNPSERITQTVPLKFALPREVKKEDIISSDPDLKIDFDPNQNALLAQANVDLGPEESRAYAVEVTDTWKVSADELKSLKAQADELMKPLQKTSAFGQGAMLKSDIDVTLNKLISNLEINRTPDARIRFFREAQIELAGVQSKLDSLKKLVTDAGSTTNLVSNFSLTQSLGVMAIIAIVLIATVFMVIYLRILKGQSVSPTVYSTDTTPYSLPVNLALAKSGIHNLHADNQRPKNHRAISATRAFMILVVVLSSAIFTLSILNIRQNRLQANKPITPVAIAPIHPTVLGDTTELIPGSPVTLIIPPNSTIKLLDDPSDTGSLLLNLKTSLKATYLQSKNGYAQIQYTLADTAIIGWVPEGLLVLQNSESK